MDWFLYDKDLRYERLKRIYFMPVLKGWKTQNHQSIFSNEINHDRDVSNICILKVYVNLNSYLNQIFKIGLEFI